MIGRPGTAVAIGREGVADATATLAAGAGAVSTFATGRWGANVGGSTRSPFDAS